MKTFDEMYPATYEGEWDGSFYGPSDYQPILNAIGPIALQVDDEDYQGDSRVLFRDGDRFGLLLFGWGSCSGCDGLQACNSKDEVVQLAQSLERDTKWLTRAEMAAYIREKDWRLEYAGHQEETQRFLSEALVLLETVEP